jgi:RHS repeat-associated protein
LQAPYTTAYQYDFLDRTTFINYPQDPASGVAIRSCYGYNSFGLVESVSVNMDQSGSGCSSKTIVNSVSYNEFTQITELVRGNGITTRYEYDIKGRVSVMRTYSGSGATELVATAYTYDRKNNIQTKVSQPTAAAVGSGYVGYNTELEYDYDGLNRLVHARGRTYEAAVASGQTLHTFEHGYGYALNGNLTTRQFFDYTSHNQTDQWNYSYQNHKVSSITSSAYGGARFSLTYNAAGNTTVKSDMLAKLPSGPGTGPVVKNMAYDSYNRIISVSSTPGPSVTGAETVGTYQYDDQGFRVRKISKQHIDGVTRTYELEYPCKYFGVERQKDTTGNIISNTTYAVNNIFLDGVRIAAVVPTGHARYFHTDQVDSVHVVTNDTGAAINRTEYLPFGETWFTEGEKAYAPKFNSQELDKESGLYFFNARHQDPELGRFETADTIIDGEDDTQGWNRYSYVQNNPVMYKDPTGHKAAGGMGKGGGKLGGTSGGKSAGKSPSSGLKSKPVILNGDGTVGPKAQTSGILSSVLDSMATGGKMLLSSPKWALEWIIGDNYGQAWGEFFGGRSATTMTGDKFWKVPESLSIGIRDVFKQVKTDAPDAAANGMHAWHAGSNAMAVEKLGILGIPALLIYGIGHETPADWRAFKTEYNNQGAVNQFLDSTTDIVANVFGMALGVFLPDSISVKAGIKLGNYIPGPGDPAREVGGEHKPYTGDPTDNWGPYTESQNEKKKK